MFVNTFKSKNDILLINTVVAGFDGSHIFIAPL